MLKLTKSDGDSTIYVNTTFDTMEEYETYKDGVHVFVGTMLKFGDRRVFVKETPEQILEKMKNLG